ncbi:glycosyl transferase [Paenibacillus sp. 32O-W]|uniref:glycosyltransferase family 2 protein n=1 Tax=Paenibacillus sp. 32O-W TaxID=1695218 RepID=UPI0007227D57|nr:glycosyltransferase family 2 protein [Paenibacillus sp. 32O-W]ALS25945.1 glycosyl transferase [Paenibacillus sp. 32O-W]
MFRYGGEYPNLTIVVPCFNEEEVLRETTNRLLKVIEKLIQKGLVSKKSSILYVDDGSCDGTWEIICSLGSETERVKGIKLAKNVGHQNALLAGLHSSSRNSDCVISIDADLQDDVNAVEEFILKFHEGYEVVYGVRSSREKDSFFKRNTAQGFYRVMKMMGVNLVYNHADYRLLSHRALIHLLEFREVNLFLRGIVPLIGFKSTNVYYARNERFAGKSKYPLTKMIKFALEGITSFSISPIRLVTLVGIIIFLLSLVAGFYALFAKIIGIAVSGWTSLILSVWFLGGIQLVGLGVLGEYVGRIYMEVKRRPKYIIEIDQYSEANKLKELDSRKELTSVL